MASTGRVHISLSYGNYEKELVNLKALLQQTLEEIKACCISQHPKSDDLDDPDASTSNQASGDLLENVNEMEPEIVKAHDRRTATTMEEGFSNDDRLRHLRQAMEDDHQQFITLIHGTHESIAQDRQMHRSEVLKAIQQNQAHRGRRSK